MGAPRRRRGTSSRRCSCASCTRPAGLWRRRRSRRMGRLVRSPPTTTSRATPRTLSPYPNRRAKGLRISTRQVPTNESNKFLTYGGNGVRHMGKRGCVGELKKKEKIITSDRILICHIGAQRVDLHDPPAFVDPHECGAPQRPPTHALDQPLTALEPRLH